jgi:hypothetical protein
MRGPDVFKPKWHSITLDAGIYGEKELMACTFQAHKEDRLVMMSDGITQSGLGKGTYLLGFGWENTRDLIVQKVNEKEDISAAKLASIIVGKAHANDNYQSKDDISSVVVYLREPRKLLLCSGPPFDKEKDDYLAEKVRSFSGKKILSGGTTVDIIAKKLDIEVEDTLEFNDPDLPPISYMHGIDLVTEGILTLSKVTNILENHNERTELSNGPADQIVKLLLESDEIVLCIGTAINVAHQDPNLPVELEIRRSVAKKLSTLLEEKFLKEVTLEFI